MKVRAIGIFYSLGRNLSRVAACWKLDRELALSAIMHSPHLCTVMLTPWDQSPRI
jgi:hypothetical protein